MLLFTASLDTERPAALRLRYVYWFNKSNYTKPRITDDECCSVALLLCVGISAAAMNTLCTRSHSSSSPLASLSPSSFSSSPLLVVHHTTHPLTHGSVFFCCVQQQLQNPTIAKRKRQERESERGRAVNAVKAETETETERPSAKCTVTEKHFFLESQTHTHTHSFLLAQFSSRSGHWRHSSSSSSSISHRQRTSVHFNAGADHLSNASHLQCE